MGLCGLRWGGAMGDRACLSIAQGLAWFSFGVGGGEPGALLRRDQAGQGFEEVFEVFKGVQAMHLGGGDEAVIPGTDLPAFSGAEEKVVFFAHGGGPDLTLDGVVIDGEVPVREHRQQVSPLAEGIIDSLAHLALRQVGLLAYVSVEEFFEAVVDRLAFHFPSQFYLFGTGPVCFEPGFDVVEQLDLLENEVGGGGRVVFGFVKFPPHVGEAGAKYDVFGAVFAQFVINGVAVAHDVAAPIFRQQFCQHFGPPAGGPVAVGADAGGVDNPQVALFGLAVAGAKVFNRCFVDVQEVAPQDRALKVTEDAGEPDFMGHARPAAHGLARQVDAVAGFIDLFLPIKWKMVGVFAGDNISKGAGANVTVFLEGGQRGNDGGAGAGLGQVFDDGDEDGAADDELAKLRRGDVEQLGLCFADFAIGVGPGDDFGGKDFALNDGAGWREDKLGATGGLFSSGGPGGLWGQIGSGRWRLRREVRRGGQCTSEEAREQEFARVHGSETFALLAVELFVEILYLGEKGVDLLLLLRDGLQKVSAFSLPRLAVLLPRRHQLLPIGGRGCGSGIGRVGCHGMLM